MRDGELAGSVRALEKFLRERQSVVTRERELVGKLDTVLQRMGYRVVRVAGPGNAGMPRRRGRPPKSQPLVAAPAGPAVKRRRRRRAKRRTAGAATAKRRGRPPKAK